MNPEYAVALIGSLDTKGAEYGYVRDLLLEEGRDVVLIDTGVLGAPSQSADVGREQVARAGGSELATIQASGERGSSMRVMAAGARNILAEMDRSGQLGAVLALGGSNAAYVLSHSVEDLPIGLPKVLVSTMAAGNTAPYVGHMDLILINPVVDINGLNRLSRQVLANAAHAVSGMLSADRLDSATDKSVIAISMFGVTTPCGTEIARQVEVQKQEALTFHATGVGGKAMEALIRAGIIDAVADITTTELADELVGGVCSAGPTRLTAAGEVGIPQIVSLGALDMVNFGRPETVPTRFKRRTFYEHNPEVTLMRTDAAECAKLGGVLAEKLNRATGPVEGLIPTQGFSMISVPGAPFHDPDADSALIDSLTGALREEIPVHKLDVDINDVTLAEKAVELLENWMVKNNGINA